MNLSRRQSDITKSRCDFVRSVGCLLTLGSLADSSAEREKDGVQRNGNQVKTITKGAIYPPVISLHVFVVRRIRCSEELARLAPIDRKAHHGSDIPSARH